MPAPIYIPTFRIKRRATFLPRSVSEGNLSNISIYDASCVCSKNFCETFAKFAVIPHKSKKGKLQSRLTKVWPEPSSTAATSCLIEPSADPLAQEGLSRALASARALTYILRLTYTYTSLYSFLNYFLIMPRVRRVRVRTFLTSHPISTPSYNSTLHLQSTVSNGL